MKNRFRGNWLITSPVPSLLKRLKGTSNRVILQNNRR